MNRKLSARRRLRQRRIAIVAGLIVVLALLGGVMIWLLRRPEPEPAPESSTPPATLTATNTTTTTAGTSIATLPPTTTTAATTTKKPTVAASDGKLDENGLLQYSTAGRYVQAASYSDSKDIPWYLLLVNDWNGMPAGYSDTITLKSVGSQQCDARIYDAMQAMFKAGSAYNIGAQSGYRAYDKQNRLYWRQVKIQTDKGYDNIRAQEIAGTIVKRPGYSEHNTGLAVDVYGSGNNSLNQAFANTKAYEWLMAHCAEYGFILRFPKGKEDITGVIWEPWHYRYVGVEAATYIMEHGLCLEEYLEQKKQ